MRKRRVKKALIAAEAEKRKRATMAREQEERNRMDIRGAGDSVRVIMEPPDGDPTPRTEVRVLDPQTSNDAQSEEGWA